MSNNLYNRFQGLSPRALRTVVTITAKLGDGTSKATTLSGTTVIVTGESVAVGRKAYIEKGAIVREAPSLVITEMPI